MIHVEPTPLAKAVSVQLRVFADLCRRWFEHRATTGGPVDRVVALRTRGVIVVAANGHLADRIEGELQRAQLISHVQIDEPTQEPASAA